MTIFYRLLATPPSDKGAELLRMVAATAADRQAGLGIYERDCSWFAAIPGTTFAYWISRSLQRLFAGTASSWRLITRAGMQTCDDFRFVRLAWEAPISGRSSGRWALFAKGGAYSVFYSDVSLMVAWGPGQPELEAFGEIKGNAARSRQSSEHYFRPGITWPSRTQQFGPRAMPAGCIFGHKGPAALAESDDERLLLASLAIMSSRLFEALLETRLNAADATARSYEVGIVEGTPMPAMAPGDEAALAELSRSAWSAARKLDTTRETSLAFVLPGGPNEQVTGFDRRTVEGEMGAIRKSIDDLVGQLYGLSAKDCAVIEVEAESVIPVDQSAPSEDDDEGGCEDSGLLGGAVASSVLSWLVGLVFCRFDPRMATGERALPPEPAPFDPLPSRSPGMYPEGEEPANSPDILVDDEGHPDDLIGRAVDMAERVKVRVPENFRGWLAGDFFPLHSKMYSKSRRKAPIYWQLATPSASYSVWLYIHAFSKDTLFRVQNDYVAPKVAHEERRLELLASELREGGTATQRKVLAAQGAFVEELRAFLEEVKRIAPLWNPDLGDGVIVNFAPLWRLVSQHKAWQKELKATWDALCEGKYDWSHLAMHLWPERIVPKCATDRSFAIAHGLEEVFWVEDGDGKWTARKSPTRPIEELVRERTSAAVKAALKSLLEAPPLTGANGARRGGRRRAAAALGEEA